MERKKRTYWKLRKRREGSSAELRDTRRRGSSDARRSTPKPVEAGCAGLRPEGVYAYAERSHGRAGRPNGTGRTVAAKLAVR